MPLQLCLGTGQPKPDIGRGCFSTVFSCTDPHGVQWAVKAYSTRGLFDEVCHCVDDPQAHLRTLFEGVAAVQHPALLPLALPDPFALGDHIFVASPRGTSLADFLLEFPCTRPPLPTACRILRRVATAVAHLHVHQFVHNFLHADNIILIHGEAFVMDFYYMHLQCYEAKRVSWSATPSFHSLDETFTAASDLWQLGVLAYLLFTGQLPFEDDNQINKHNAIKAGEYPPLPEDLPEEARQIVTDLLQRDPTARTLTPALLAWLAAQETQSLSS